MRIKLTEDEEKIRGKGDIGAHPRSQARLLQKEKVDDSSMSRSAFGMLVKKGSRISNYDVSQACSAATLAPQQVTQPLQTGACLQHAATSLLLCL